MCTCSPRMAFTFKRTFHTLRSLSTDRARKGGFATGGMNPVNLPPEFFPPVNRFMRELDKSFFRKTVPISAATIFDPRDVATTRKALELTGENLMLWPIKNIVPDPEVQGAKCLLLRPGVDPTESGSWSKTLKDLSDQGKVRIRPYDLELTYEDYGMKMILDAIIPEMPPEDSETPVGFSITGHVAHINLREQYLPYKNIIGQVILDKNPSITTVINKLDVVGTESEFRTFPYEVIAGPDNLDVVVNVSDCEFKFNYGKVYWNTRLNTEHMRIIEMFKPGEVVCDVMAGVGPFSVPAGKRNVFVWANDLNPDCHKALEWAAKRNKVAQYVKGFCMDGRDFIRYATATLPKTRRLASNLHLRKGQPATKTIVEEPEVFGHYIMNLPQTALEFLDAFHGLFAGSESLFKPWSDRKLPMIHVYLFTERKGASNMQTEAEEEDICTTISHYLGHKITRQTPALELLYVRLVSPKKKYYRASFRLPPEVAFATSPNDQNADAWLESHLSTLSKP